MKKTQFISLFLTMLLAGAFLPASRLEAQTSLLPFAGIVSFKITCDCSGGLQWIWFSPLYLGGDEVTTGPMVYSPYSTILYAYYNIGQSGLWHLGDYTPGVQSCWKIAGNSCVLLPSYGLMSKVGTNYSSNGGSNFGGSPGGAGTPIQAP